MGREIYNIINDIFNLNSVVIKMIKTANKENVRTLAEMAIKMWSDSSISELAEGFEELISSDKARCFIKYVDEKAVGFAQCQLRTDYVEGTDSSPVGYLEGIFVEKGYRKLGRFVEHLNVSVLRRA